MPLPALRFYNCQDSVALDLDRLADCAGRALPPALAEPGPGDRLLDSLAEIEVTFVSDEAIGAVHAEFLDDPSPTDVITFQHGEILVSAETAAAAAPAWGHSPQREALLYVIHGLLHLNGHDDHDPEGAAAMKRIQESILAAVWPTVPGEIEIGPPGM